jgi:hypothetical protein
MKNDTLPPVFANPKPVKRNENPTAVAMVDGKLVPLDTLIYQMQTSTYLALKWVEELRQKVHKMERAILYATDALDVGTLAEYVEEIQALEQEAMDDQGEDVP